MRRKLSSTVAQRCRLLAGLAGVLASVVGALGLVGWALGEPHLTRVASPFRPILPHTSIGLVLEGAALVLLAKARAPRRVSLAGRILALTAVLVGAIELYEWQRARPVFLDRAFTTPAPTFLTALGVVVVGVSLLLLDVRTSRRRQSPAQYLVIACLASALVVVVGYIYQEPTLYELPVETFPALGMALPSAAGLAFLCIGLLCARPGVGLMASVTSGSLGGAFARRFLLAVLAAPLVGLIGMAGERLFGWEQEVAEGLLAASGMVVGAALILTTARSLNHVDAARQRALEEVLEWKDFFDRAAWGAVLTGADGTILKANAAYATLHGYEPGELEGLPIARLVPEARRAELAELFARVDDVGHRRFECERERKDGTRFHSVIDATAVRRGDGSLSHYVTYLQDISEQKAAEQAQARLAAIVETSEDAILSSDTNAVLLTANAAAERLFGYSAEELIGRSATMFLPPEQSDEIERHLVRIRRGEHVIGFETVRMRKDGSRFPASVTISPVRDRDDRITMVSSVVRDITALKELERQREEWASLVAHDLRQPLNAISLHAQVALLRFERTEPNAVTRGVDSLRQILASTQRLDRMVGDVGDVSRIEANRLSLELSQVDLGVVVNELLARTAPMTAGRAVSSRTNGVPRRVTVDPARIEQVLSNLISNALKYGDPGTEIAVDIEWRDADVGIAVTNHGPGIGPVDLGRIFSRFERTASARASRVPGLGVGLYICRGLVEAHGGRLWVDSTPHATTTFHVDLPAPRIAKSVEMFAQGEK